MSRRWYEDLQHPHPFVLHEKIELHARIRCINPFPEIWSNDIDNALPSAWANTKLFDPELAQQLHLHSLNPILWREMIDLFKNALVVADDQRINIIWPSGSTRSVQIELRELSQPQVVPLDKVNVTWALSPHKPYEPMVVFSYCRLIYIFNARMRVLEGCLRGHGGEITSIVVHPHAAHIFCTTSRDFSSRLYDLTRTPQLHANNPHWPPLEKPSFAGPSHGLDMSIEEGEGIGRCVLVLVGGRSGGHAGEVFGAAFHYTHPVIATCGMDRAIKIWHIPPFSNRLEQRLLREDKPLFSSSSIHKARVLSVNWLSRDILLSHSAPARMFVLPESSTSETNPESTDSKQFGPDEPGSLSLWKWLSIDRFFPPDWEKAASRQVRLNPFKSVYQESISFKILSNYLFPPQIDQFVTPTLYVCRGGSLPFVIYSYPHTQSLTILNIALLKRRLLPPPLPGKSHSSDLWRHDEQIQGWDLALDDSLGREETVETCAMISGSSPIIIIGGSRGSFCVFSGNST
ncbi:hypothetical protein DFH05DRAFT_85119 [Lentinula detonsa]|uniref:WD40 repeat-like protein n=1 Tax=Lentinula detonsa TaxID=2804962 RepID=A0A9W8U329_9AGAR|nr:hypothetical protein DFH05DRAFT_85119 [Lentinula detonsa]